MGGFKVPTGYIIDLASPFVGLPLSVYVDAAQSLLLGGRLQPVAYKRWIANYIF